MAIRQWICWRCYFRVFVRNFYVDTQWNLYCQVYDEIYKCSDHGITWNQIAVDYPALIFNGYSFLLLTLQIQLIHPLF